MRAPDGHEIRISWLEDGGGTSADTEAIEKLQEEVFGCEYQQEDLVDLELAAHSEALVARHGDDIVGVALIVRPGAPRFWFERVAPIGAASLPPDLTRENVSELDGTIVTKPFRGHGLGKILARLQHLVARERGARYGIGLSTPMMRGIVEELGGFTWASR